MPKKIINKELLLKTGFGDHDPSRYSAKNIILRDGRQAVLWEDSLTGHGILDPEFWEDSDYYLEQYRKEFSSDLGKQLDAEKHFEIHRELNQRQYKQFSDLLTPATSYLEIGCSYGGLIDLVIKNNVHLCHAVEANEADAEYVKKKYGDKVEVFNGLFEDVDLSKNAYDLIVSFEVLEHTVSPRQMISKAVSQLKPDGMLHLEVPNYRDALLKFYKNQAYNNFYYHKAHIHYFTPDSLLSLAADTGLEGKVDGFQMYPFFNQVYWLFNNKPQGPVNIAASTPKPCDDSLTEQSSLCEFYRKVADEYEVLAKTHNMCDCLIYQGRKSEGL